MRSPQRALLVDQRVEDRPPGSRALDQQHHHDGEDGDRRRDERRGLGDDADDRVLVAGQQARDLARRDRREALENVELDLEVVELAAGPEDVVDEVRERAEEVVRLQYHRPGHRDDVATSTATVANETSSAARIRFQRWRTSQPTAGWRATARTMPMSTQSRIVRICDQELEEADDREDGERDGRGDADDLRGPHLLEVEEVASRGSLLSHAPPPEIALTRRAAKRIIGPRATGL